MKIKCYTHFLRKDITKSTGRNIYRTWDIRNKCEEIPRLCSRMEYFAAKDNLFLSNLKIVFCA